MNVSASKASRFHCPLCGSPLDSVARCTRCGEQFPTVSGIAVLLAQPIASLAAVRNQVMSSWARSATLASDRTFFLADPVRLANATAAMAVNQALFERIVAPALAELRTILAWNRSPPSSQSRMPDGRSPRCCRTSTSTGPANGTRVATSCAETLPAMPSAGARRWC